MSDDPNIPNDPKLAFVSASPSRDGSGGFSRRLQALAATRRQRARQLRDGGDEAAAGREDHDAAYLERHADRLRDPLQFALVGAPLVVGNGGEVIPAPAPDIPPNGFTKSVLDPPDMLAAEATELRMLLTATISETALTMAIEVGESIGARDALERNLAHQMAAAHVVGMTMLAQAHGFTRMVLPWSGEERQQMQSIEAARMATAAARVLDISQRAVLALERLRNGGRQVVTVQHVSVRKGGQAVVAGTVERGGRRK